MDERIFERGFEVCVLGRRKEMNGGEGGLGFGLEERGRGESAKLVGEASWYMI